MFSSSSQKKLKITCVVFPFNTNVLGQCSAVQESESIPRPFLQRIEYQPLANHQALSRKNQISNLVDIKLKESKNLKTVRRNNAVLRRAALSEPQQRGTDPLF
jgi:hypothetical protein